MFKVSELLADPRLLRWRLNLYPPYLGAGIRVHHLARDFRDIRVSMNLRWYNRNYVGTHFGGSLYAMTDPFFMLMLIQNLGREYIVWDKASAIEFVNPGRGRVHAHFELTQDRIDRICKQAAVKSKILPQFVVAVRDDQDEVVAQVTKTLYVRRKRAHSDE